MTKTKILKTIGINSICQDGYNIIMLDYDINKKDTNSIQFMIDEITNLIVKYRLSNFYLIESTNGYNAFCIDKITINLLKQIFNDCPLVDKMFKKLSIKKGYSTIRIGSDKEYKLTIGFSCRSTLYIKSKVHANALIYYFGVPIKNIKPFDNSTFVKLCKYENLKYGLWE